MKLLHLHVVVDSVTSVTYLMMDRRLRLVFERAGFDVKIGGRRQRRERASQVRVVDQEIHDAVVGVPVLDKHRGKLCLVCDGVNNL